MKRVIITLLSIMYVGLFAHGTTEENTRSIRTSHSRIEFETIGEKQIEPSAAIVAFFTNHADYPVPAEYLNGNVDLKLIPNDILENIDLLLGESKIDIEDAEDADEAKDLKDEAEDLKDSAADLRDLIRVQLQESLIKGEIEYTYMKIGRNLFTTHYDF